VLTIEPERLNLESGAKVLDLGCGDGRHIRATRRMVGVTGIALDLGEKEVARTAASLQELDNMNPAVGGTVPGAGPWSVVRGDGYALPFATGSFDCVIISEVLEHLHHDDDALEELTRVLRPGGLLAVSVPRAGPEAICWVISHRYRSMLGGHVRIYSRAALRQKLVDHGYEVFASHFAHGLHSPFWWLKCIVGVDNEDSLPVRLYHQLLVWDLMKRPFVTRLAEKLLNPFIGKSVVFYAVKG
jgi:SAM-dependent methyltransferase